VRRGEETTRRAQDRESVVQPRKCPVVWTHEKAGGKGRDGVGWRVETALTLPESLMT